MSNDADLCPAKLLQEAKCRFLAIQRGREESGEALVGVEGEICPGFSGCFGLYIGVCFVVYFACACVGRQVCGHG